MPKKSSGRLNKKKLLVRSKRAADEVRRRRLRKEQQQAERIVVASTQLAALEAQIEASRSASGSGGPQQGYRERLKLERDAKKAELAELKRQADPAFELQRVDAEMTAAKELHRAEQIARQARFRKQALTENKRRIIKLGRPAQHARAFVVDQPEHLLIGRKHVPLGESDPSLLRIGWHRDDYRLPPGKTDFKRVDTGQGFAPARATGRLRLGGPGDHLREPGAPAPVSISRGSRPSEGAARHPRAWQSADAVGREFHRYDYFRPPTAHEAKLAALLTQPDRARYRPEDEGKPSWRASDTQGQAAFSRAQRDDEVLRGMEERKERDTFRRLGIEQPLSVHARAEAEAARRRSTPAPHAALLRKGQSAMGIPRAALVAAQRTGANLLCDPRLGGRRAAAASPGLAGAAAASSMGERSAKARATSAGALGVSRSVAAAARRVEGLVQDALARTEAFREARVAARAASRGAGRGSGRGGGGRGLALPPLLAGPRGGTSAGGGLGAVRPPGAGAGGMAAQAVAAPGEHGQERSRTMRPGFGGLVG